MLLLAATLPCAAQTNHALGKTVTADSARVDYPATFAADGVLSDPSRWLADASPTGHWLEIDLGAPTTLRQAHIYSGYLSEAGSPIDSFSLQSWNGTAWQPIPGAAIAPNGSFATILQFNSAVTTSKVRLVVADTTVIRVREISLWENPQPLFTGITGEQFPAWHPAYANLALGKPATTNGRVTAPYSANYATDGETSDASRVLAQPPNSPTGPLWVEVNLTTPATIAEAHIYSNPPPDAAFHLEMESGGNWTTIPGSTVTGNGSSPRRVTFTAPVTTSRIRYVADGLSANGYSRLQEITLWGQSNVPLNYGLFVGSPAIIVPETPVALNQIGFQKGAPKRFTAITCADGTPFEIASVSDLTTPLHTGTITGGLGDFSAFNPASSGPYLVRVAPATGSAGLSDPFLILDDLIGEKYLAPAVQFMNDARSAVGTHPSAFGGAPWRDGTYYSFEIPSLVHLLLTRREAVVALPREIDLEAEKTRVLAPAFDTTYQSLTASNGFLPALRRYYSNYEAPRSNAPDLVKIIHFGMGVTLERPATKDWSGDERPEQIHAQTVEWAAWILYAWPVLREWLPESFYIKTRDFAFSQWGVSSGLGTTTNNKDDDPSSLEIDPLWYPATYTQVDKAPFKGRHAPGHSIWPNLLMHEVALREGRSDAAIYLQAAQMQAQWIIDNLDWNDPKTTKGHRMSENKMMPGLVYFLQKYPSAAPAGLKAKIAQWADVMIARSANAYDFRRYNDTEWSIPAGANSWNEPGNLAGFPACALAAAWTLDDPAKQQRLREISWAAIDCLFGRNPLLASSPGRPVTLANGNPGGFPDAERGWPKLYTGSAAFLENSRGALCSGPGTEHFPNNPNATLRHHEPWTNFNAAWNLSLAYMAADLDGTHETHAIPQPFNAPADSDANHDQIPDLIQHASTGLTRPYEKPTLIPATTGGGPDIGGPGHHTLEVLHNLQAYDSTLIVEWTTTLEPNDWHPATYQATEDIPHNNGTLTRKWHIPNEQPGLFYRLRATRP